MHPPRRAVQDALRPERQPAVRADNDRIIPLIGRLPFLPLHHAPHVGIGPVKFLLGHDPLMGIPDHDPVRPVHAHLPPGIETLISLLPGHHMPRIPLVPDNLCHHGRIPAALLPLREPVPCTALPLLIDRRCGHALFIQYLYNLIPAHPLTDHPEDTPHNHRRLFVNHQPVDILRVLPIPEKTIRPDILPALHPGLHRALHLMGQIPAVKAVHQILKRHVNAARLPVQHGAVVPVIHGDHPYPQEGEYLLQQVPHLHIVPPKP